MTAEELVRFWGEDRLRRWPIERLRTVEIPEASRRFLSEVGLPHRDDWTLRFDPEAEDLPPLPGKPRLRRIGFDYHVPICLDEESGGRVVKVDPEGGAVGLINSDVERLADCLTIYEDYRDRVAGLSEEEAQSLISEVEGRMKTADPHAFDDPENWWPVVIEQMRDGML
jgi:hypothetical protein